MGDPLPPQKFDGYELVRPLGSGGMGHVYLARDTVLERLVAVKLVSNAHADAAARERFRLEGRAIARLQHPNVVSIYAIGELDGVPYLVSEFIEGVGLDKLAKPIPWARARDIGLGVARALAAAHRRGVVHRDVKPANVVLSEEGEAKLLDFGIARLLDTPDVPSVAAQTVGEGSDEAPDGDACATAAVTLDALAASDARLTRAGVALGTPAYMAPEVWRGEGATFRSDVYSLGCVLYALCVGRPPHDARPEELRAIVASRDARPLAEVARDVDPAFAAVVDRCLRRDPNERFADGNDLRAALGRIGRERVDALPEGNPYRGLQAFEAEHRAVYFGRDSEVRTILDRLRSGVFVLVAGDSGVGKSSLCRAGVLPHVAELDARRAWKEVSLVPGRHPVASVSAALAAHLGVGEDEIARALADDPGAVARDLRRCAGATEGLVVFVDQIEELVTLSDPKEAALVAELLGRLATPGPAVRVLATVRGDFLSRLATLPVLSDEIARALYFLWPLSEERVREAIVGPARAKDVRFESDALVDSLVASTARADGSLPLLQFTLAELWEARDRSNGVIPASALDAIGGVAGALSRHADDLLARMLPAERKAARDVLLRLVHADGTRARRGEREVVEDGPQRGALEALVRGRVVVARETSEGSGYEIAHEALVRGWRTLTRWMAEDRDAGLVRERLSVAIDEWERLGRAREALWSARQLDEAARIDAASLQSRERRFLDASRRALRRGRMRRLAVAAAIPVALASSYGVVAHRAKADVARRVGAHLVEARSALDEAHAKRTRLAALEHEAFEAFDRPDDEAGERSWARALALAAEIGPAYARASRELETALLLDGGRRDVRGQFADVLLERALFAEERRSPRERDELLSRMALYDDGGARQRSLDAPGLVTIRSDPPAEIAIERAVADEHGRRAAQPIGRHAGGVAERELPAGSYVATLRAPGRAVVRHPFVVARGARARIDVDLPLAADVPEGFVHVPAGRFLFGSQAEDSVRRGFFHTVPIHEVRTGAFSIARRETTFADWIAYLRALPPDARAAAVPSVKGGFQGALTLTDTPRGFELSFQPATHSYTARAGAPIVYRERDRRASQDWLAFPVFGISAADAEAYARWLDRTGRVAGARLCTELEWEHAARGADDRLFPHGDELAPDDANFDETYGRAPLAMGPDVVGSHPESASPFLADDMAGNVWEWTRSSLGAGHAARGGSYYFDVNSSRVSNREVTEPSFRDVTVGMRVCADARPHAESARRAESAR